MDPADRDRLRDDLAAALDGELLLDDLRRGLYATDASLFEVPPLAVVRPRSEADVQAVVRYAAEHQLPVTARGAGTGTAGAALGPGLVLDFSRFLHDIVAVGPDTVRVRTGATWERVAARLARDGRRLTVEPAGAATSTLGGIVAANAAGPRAARLGYPRDQVVAVRAVLDSGDAVDFTPLPQTPPPDAPARLAAIHRATVALLDRNAEAIVAERPRTPFNRCGYLLHDVLTADALDYPRLLAGTEGTLALFTEVTLRTEPLPGGRGVALFACGDLHAALKAVGRVLPRRPAACELLDGRLLSLVRARGGELVRLLPAHAGAALLVEFEADSGEDARRQTLDLIDGLVREHLALLAVPALAPDEARRVWALVDAALPGLETLRGGPPAVTGVEDVGVPPAELPAFLTRVQDVLQRHETTAAMLVHAAAGQVHLRPFLDPAIPADAARLWAIAEDTYALALELGGTVSGRHGTGLARTPWVAKQYPRLATVFRDLKTIFDPREVFNPGNVVGPDPRRPAWPMRQKMGGQSPPGAPGGLDGTPLLLWKPDEFPAQVAACHGCGACRTQTAPQRMCPIFRATQAEEATPRAKANLLRDLLRPGVPGGAGSPDSRRLAEPDVRAVADLCVNCKMCAHECPSHVDVPRLMLEAKAAHVAEHGLDRPDWVMARLRLFSRAGSAVALLANRLLRGPMARWVMEKFFGVSRRRRLPPFATRSFLRQAARLGWTRKESVVRRPSSVAEYVLATDDGPRTADKVALFVDIFANYHDPQIAEAAVRVLGHSGVAVVVPPDQRSCGMEALAQGDVETAREIVRHNLRVFADLAREGYRIVCTEPTAAVMLRHDTLDLLDDPDARLIADRTVELTAYLWELHERGRLRTDFRPLPLPLGHHVPCHIKALGRPPAGPALLGLIPQARVHTIDVSCSGMAGTYGLRADAYETSLAAGKPMLDELRRPRVLFGSTECSACRLQMEEGSGKRTLHPVQYLALAYGLMPELARRLKESEE
ncbi:MAG TPA: FAD-linked oxidase C-terminal domain-containing protein [Gemmataceae bacterium]|jgi:FAD/FMN-containing dehydrogenase/Fe-S oxidoreductase